MCEKTGSAEALPVFCAALLLFVPVLLLIVSSSMANTMKTTTGLLSVFEYITGITIGNLAGYVSLEAENHWYLGMLSLGVWKET